MTMDNYAQRVGTSATKQEIAEMASRGRVMEDAAIIAAYSAWCNTQAFGDLPHPYPTNELIISVARALEKALPPEGRDLRTEIRGLRAQLAINMMEHEKALSEIHRIAAAGNTAWESTNDSRAQALQNIATLSAAPQEAAPTELEAFIEAHRPLLEQAGVIGRKP